MLGFFLLDTTSEKSALNHKQLQDANAHGDIACNIFNSKAQDNLDKIKYIYIRHWVGLVQVITTARYQAQRVPVQVRAPVHLFPYEHHNRLYGSPGTLYLRLVCGTTGTARVRCGSIDPNKRSGLVCTILDGSLSRGEYNKVNTVEVHVTW